MIPAHGGSAVMANVRRTLAGIPITAVREVGQC